MKELQSLRNLKDNRSCKPRRAAINNRMRKICSKNRNIWLIVVQGGETSAEYEIEADNKRKYKSRTTVAFHGHACILEYLCCFCFQPNVKLLSVYSLHDEVDEPYVLFLHRALDLRDGIRIIQCGISSIFDIGYTSTPIRRCNRVRRARNQIIPRGHVLIRREKGHRMTGITLSRTICYFLLCIFGFENLDNRNNVRMRSKIVRDSFILIKLLFDGSSLGNNGKFE